MKKLALLLTILALAFPAQAVEIGDIYYSNKSFSSTPLTDCCQSASSGRLTMPETAA